MKFHEAMRELLDGCTVRCVGLDERTGESVVHEFSFDGKKTDLKKICVVTKPDGTCCEEVIADTGVHMSLTFYPEDILSSNWEVCDGSQPVAEAFKAFCDGKWIRHRKSANAIKMELLDPSICYRCYNDPIRSKNHIYRESTNFDTIKNLFIHKDGWFIYDCNNDETIED